MNTGGYKKKLARMGEGGSNQSVSHLKEWHCLSITHEMKGVNRVERVRRLGSSGHEVNLLL